MIANNLTDLLIGITPVLGDFADVVYQADLRNVALLKKYSSRRSL